MIARALMRLQGRAGASFDFPCRTWLPEPDAPTPNSHIVLLPGVAPAESATVAYEVTVQTSADRWSGTDANVSLRITGEGGCTRAMPLESARNNFERGRLETFVVRACAVGAITSVQVWLTGVPCRSESPAWTGFMQMSASRALLSQLSRALKALCPIYFD